MRVLAYVPDLIDRSKLSGALPGVVLLRRPEELDGCEADLVVVDLGRPGVLEVLPRVRATRLIGFASHVDRGALAAARAVGCDAMARSKFFSSLAELSAAAPAAASELERESG